MVVDLESQASQLGRRWLRRKRVFFGVERVHISRLAEKEWRVGSLCCGRGCNSLGLDALVGKLHHSMCDRGLVLLPRHRDPVARSRPPDLHGEARGRGSRARMEVVVIGRGRGCPDDSGRERPSSSSVKEVDKAACGSVQIRKSRSKSTVWAQTQTRSNAYRTRGSCGSFRSVSHPQRTPASDQP